MRLNPLDPRGLGASRIGTAHALFFLGDYDEASSWAALGLLTNPDAPGGLRFAAASDAMAGRLEQAHNAVARLRQLNSTYVFPISKRCWALIGLPKTSRNTKKDCGGLGCLNEQGS
jgi:hypothetical protein